MDLPEKAKQAPYAPVWNQSFPSHRHWLSAAPSLSGATLLTILEGVPLSAPGDAGGRRSAPAR